MSQEITTKDCELVDLLNTHPNLKERVVQLLHVVEDTDGNLEKADAAEQRVIEEVRKIGHTALTEWATNKNSQYEQELAEREGIRLAGEKNSGGRAPLIRLK